MQIIYSKSLDLQPLPVSATIAARLSRVLQKKIDDAGGREKAVKKAADVIIASSSDDSPSERSRLHVLYAQVYSRIELEGLALNTFDALGLED